MLTMSKNSIIKGTVVLTCSGLAARFIGFFYRIFLSHSIGAQELGTYNLAIPLQMLILSLSTFGIQTILSRQTASYIALGRKKEAKDYFLTGTITAFFLSSLFSFFLYKYHIFFASEILKAQQTAPLIRIIALGIPLSTLHICANSYYFAQKKAVIPSAIQLLEQTVRVGSTYLLFLIFQSNGREATALIAAGGALASEVASAIVSLFAIGFGFHKTGYSITKLSKPMKKAAEIVKMSFPISTNRILLTLLSSIEIVLIPQRLCMSGLSPENALSVYGIFTGMAMPLILFPSTITNSASVMLVPSVAQLQALGKKSRIRFIVSRTSFYCITLGSICALFFFFLGKPLGMFLFGSKTAGAYIQTMGFICPFLYLNTMLSSILNGLGKTGTNLLHSATGLGIRIAFVLFAIPSLGIRGYLYGILSSELTVTVIHLLALFRLPHKNV